MRITRDYKTKKQRAEVIEDMAGRDYRLVEEQYYFDGKHLIFDNHVTIEQEIDSLRSRIAALEARL